jgi:putative salt-induced outer membrane protein
MQRISFIAVAAVIASAGIAQAQDTVFTGTDTVEDRNEALREDIEEDFERDTRIGNEGRSLGFSGSIALRASASDGNTDTAAIGLGANYTWFDGANGFGVQLSYSYAEDEGVTTEESLLYDLEYTRDFNPRFFAFAKLQGSLDEFSSYETDTFLGVGVGYRVISTPDTQWSVQAGPGYRVAELDDVIDRDFEESAIAVSSNFSSRFNESVLFTNDTDVIASDSDTVVYNDLGVNYAIGTDGLALRTSVQTEYHTDPVPGRKDTDNTFGLSLVYSFD